MSFLVSLVSSPLFISLSFSFLTMAFLPGLLNYTVLTQFPDRALIIIPTIIFFVSFIKSFIISLSSSISECNRYRLQVCLKQALNQAFWTTTVYLLIFFVPFLKSGFTDIGGDTLFSNSIGEGFILAFTSLILTLVNYFDSKRLGCQLNSLESEKEYSNIEKKLNSRKKSTS